MTKAYIIYRCDKDKPDAIIAAAPNLRDVLAIGSTKLEEAINKGWVKPEFKVQSCEIEGGLVKFVNLSLDIQIGAKIVTREPIESSANAA